MRGRAEVRDVDDLKDLMREYLDLVGIHGETAAELEAFRKSRLELNRRHRLEAIEISRLKGQPGRDIWLFGGGSLFRSLLGAGLVDTVELAVIPVLLGRGLQLLPEAAERTRLGLSTHKVYGKSGTVALEYDVA